MSAGSREGPPRPEASGGDAQQEYLVETKVAGALMRVTVIDPNTGAEAVATGPNQRGIERSLINIAINKLKRGVRA